MVVILNVKFEKTIYKMSAVDCISKEFARVCFAACEKLRRPTRVAILAFDIFKQFLPQYLIQLKSSTMLRSSGLCIKNKLIKKQLKKQLLLRILSCIQLASKIKYSHEIIKFQELDVLIKEENLKYDVDSLKKSELEVFEMIGFHVPLFTVIDEIENLIEICISPTHSQLSKLLVTSKTIVKLIYLQHEKFYSKLKWAVGKKDYLENDKNYLKRLLPAAIICSSYKLIYGHVLVNEKLVETTRYSYSDIRGVSSTILLLLK